MSAGPLSGVKVLEVAQVIAGPWCAAILAEQGAEVIKVESLEGDSLRRSSDGKAGIGSIFYNCNRAKRCVALDLSSPEGRSIIERLAAEADVFIQNFRPGKADRLGIGYDALSAVNPSLVYASISGMGASGPDAGRPTYDFVIQAMIGMADSQRDPDGRPHLIKNYVIDKATAQSTAQAITAALFARERDPQHRGQHCQIAMLDVGVHFFWPDGMMQHTLLDDDVARVPSNHDVYDAYPTADGAIAMQPIIPAIFPRLAVALDRPQWLTDERFNPLETRRHHFSAFAAEVAEAMRSASTEELMALFEAHDVPAAAVLTPLQALSHPQIGWNGNVVETDSGPAGKVRFARTPARFSTTPTVVDARCATLGEHTVEVLTELGYSAAQLEALARAAVIPPTR